MACAFNGTNQSLTSASAPTTAAPLTLACWFNPTSNTTRTVCLDISDAASTGAFFAIVPDGAATGDPLCATQYGASASTAEALSSAAYTINQQNHGAAVFTSNSSRTSYLNGANAGTNTASVNAGTFTAPRVGIGALVRAPIVAFYPGNVSEAAIWNIALTDAEIASLAKGFKPYRIRPQSLVFYAPLIRELRDWRQAVAITNNNGATVANHPRVY